MIPLAYPPPSRRMRGDSCPVDFLLDRCLRGFKILFIPRNDNGQEKRSVLIVSVLLPIIIDLVSYGTLVAVSAPRVMLLHDSDIPIGMFHLRLVINNQLSTIDLALRSKKQRRI